MLSNVGGGQYAVLVIERIMPTCTGTALKKSEECKIKILFHYYYYYYW